MSSCCVLGAVLKLGIQIHALGGLGLVGYGDVCVSLVVEDMRILWEKSRLGALGGSVGPVGAQEDSQKSQHVTSRDKRQGLLVGRESPEEKALEPESV